MLGRLSTAAIISVLGFVAYAVYHSSAVTIPKGTFDQCVVDEMRGQSIFMEPNVRKMCAQRFGLIYDITNSGIAIDWGVTGDAKQSSTIPNPLYSVALGCTRTTPNGT
jgi:hypothetical protein